MKTKERRFGQFRIHRDLLDQAPKDALLKMFSKMIIVRAEMNYSTQTIDYIAESELFDPVPEYCAAPHYEIIFTRIMDRPFMSERLEVSAKLSDQNPAPASDLPNNHRRRALRAALLAYWPGARIKLFLMRARLRMEKVRFLWS